ncbi:MAG TPA: sigma factor, ECF subfamily protein [Verrucomicrobiales bacterium]|nr:sigma factor, ECF subfamily protein [Verrucomicrobiales bacterium]
MNGMEPPDAAHSSGDIPRVVEHLFRHESGRLIATLTRIFGVEHLTLAEDVVQEALARALQTWPFRGVPENPAAWIMRTSRNLALDHVRRERTFRDKEQEIVRIMGEGSHAADPSDPADEGLADDRLRMLFVCCHPRIPVESQIALALKVLGGFSPAEIGKAFLTTEAAIAKRLTRARQQLHDAGIPFSIPEGTDLTRRIDAVLQSLYLLFNEGYKASSGDQLVRADVCHEAIRLGALLTRRTDCDLPKVHALLALMFFNTARLTTRVDAAGNLLLLKDQDRSRWDGSMIAQGMFHLTRSAAGEAVAEFHLQAGIAACHAAAINYESTDWSQILVLYDQLARMDASPVVALNRAIAVANVHGPEAGLAAIAAIEDPARLESYHLLHAVRGELESQANRPAVAIGHFQRALELTSVKSEQEFLVRRLQALRQMA